MKAPLPIRWLERFYRGRHAQSLAGDLMEERTAGRSSVWLWWQALTAIFSFQLRQAGKAVWSRGLSITGRILIETSLMLCIVVVIDEWRRSHSIAGWFSLKGIFSLSILVAMGVLGYALRTRAKNLLLVITVSLLGAGTLVWANTTLADVCEAPAGYRTLAP